MPSLPRAAPAGEVRESAEGRPHRARRTNCATRPGTVVPRRGASRTSTSRGPSPGRCTSRGGNLESNVESPASPTGTPPLVVFLRRRQPVGPSRRRRLADPRLHGTSCRSRGGFKQVGKDEGRDWRIPQGLSPRAAQPLPSATSCCPRSTWAGQPQGCSTRRCSSLGAGGLGSPAGAVPRGRRCGPPSASSTWTVVDESNLQRQNPPQTSSASASARVDSAKKTLTLAQPRRETSVDLRRPARRPTNVDWTSSMVTT